MCLQVFVCSQGGVGKKNGPKRTLCILPECVLVKCILLLQTVGYIQLVIQLKFDPILRHSAPRLFLTPVLF